ncbi:MAG: isocitrate/isopropylmalate family dehydrogenase, partial [Acidobacteriota bacterium]|nr:isocitrate/isopropylmalate family dehydrogenase [Acidobacteriota bacterium]
AVHGSAPDIAGQNLANPIALLRSGILMLDHLELREAATRVRKALHEVVAVAGVRTRDIGGEASTSEFTDALVAALG